MRWRRFVFSLWKYGEKIYNGTITRSEELKELQGVCLLHLGGWRWFQGCSRSGRRTRDTCPALPGHLLWRFYGGHSRSEPSHQRWICPVGNKGWLARRRCRSSLGIERRRKSIKVTADKGHQSNNQAMRLKGLKRQDCVEAQIWGRLWRVKKLPEGSNGSEWAIHTTDLL